MAEALAGALPVTSARVLRIALPIVLSNATVPLLGAVDTGVVGQMGAAAPIGAVGVGAIVLTAVYGIFAFLRMGTSGLAAQAEGAADRAETEAILLRALLLALAVGAALILAQAPLVAVAFRLSPASAEVEGLARAYLALRIWGAPAVIALFALSGWLIARERAATVLALHLWMNGVNIGLDLWFVLGLGWGVEGVAAATLAAEWSGLALALWVTRGALAGAARGDRRRLLDRARLLRMAGVNADIMQRSLLLQGAFAAFIFLGAGFGDVTLAANQVLFQFLGIASQVLDGFALAAEALVGQAMGARSVAGVRRSAALASLWGLATALLLAAAFAAFGPAMVAVMARDAEVQATARAYLPWVVALPVLSVGAYLCDGIFIGATATRAMRNAMLVAVAVFAALILALHPGAGNGGLWAAVAAMNLARLAAMLAAYPAVERALAPVRPRS
ncbi:MAG: MATE family efflux transporter [Rhodobacteraceae bacterium]|nr:MATE family efflux transporter [Paracoccaceae bacterium]